MPGSSTTPEGENVRKRIIRFIDGYHKRKGYPPTYREITEGLGISSVSVVAFHLDNLMARGFVTRSLSTARTLLITDAGREYLCQQ